MFRPGRRGKQAKHIRHIPTGRRSSALRLPVRFLNRQQRFQRRQADRLAVCVAARNVDNAKARLLSLCDECPCVPVASHSRQLVCCTCTPKWGEAGKRESAKPRASNGKIKSPRPSEREGRECYSGGGIMTEPNGAARALQCVCVCVQMLGARFVQEINLH